MNFTGNNRKLIIVHESMRSGAPSESVNVMVTPQFYTYKQEALPVRYAYQAKKIAPSLFDGLLEEGKYEYFVQKGDEGWEFIAYDPHKIRAFLEQKGYSPNRVGKLFFAQQAVEHLMTPLALGEEQALVNLNGVATVIPTSVLERPPMIDEPLASWTPKRGVSIAGGSHGSLLSLTRKQTLALAAPLVVFGLVWIVEGVRLGSGSSQAIEAKIAQLLSAHPALQSSYTRQSVAQKYRTIDHIERKKREIIKHLSKIVGQGVTLTSLEMDQAHFVAKFSLSNKAMARSLERLAKNEHYKVSYFNGGKAVQVEGKL